MDSGVDSWENVDTCEPARLWHGMNEASFRASSKGNDGGVVGPKENW
jgi:hypothetical protein